MSAAPLIFISCIDEERAIANTLRRWLIQIYQDTIQVHVAVRNTAKGAEWFASIRDKLREAALVLVLCSRASVTNNWLFFETGTAWGRDKPIVPICHSGMAQDLLPPQWGSFQGYQIDHGMKFITEFIESIQAAFGLSRKDTIDIDQMQSELTVAVGVAQAAVKQFSLFLSMPMRSIETSNDVDDYRSDAKKILDSIDRLFGANECFFGGRDMVEGREETPAPDNITTHDNIGALARSRRFLMIYPERLATTSLVEIGIAFAQRLPCVVFHRDIMDFPSGLRELDQVYSQIHYYKYQKLSDIVKLISKYGTRLFIGGN